MGIFQGTGGMKMTIIYAVIILVCATVPAT